VFQIELNFNTMVYIFKKTIESSFVLDESSGI